MRNLKWIAAAVLSSGLAFGASAATVAANMGTCTPFADQVKTALDSNAQSANLQDAQKEAGLGRDFCNNSLYARGIAHYQHALDLLGANRS
jgi:hypothetical protein